MDFPSLVNNVDNAKTSNMGHRIVGHTTNKNPVNPIIVGIS